MLDGETRELARTGSGDPPSTYTTRVDGGVAPRMLRSEATAWLNFSRGTTQTVVRGAAIEAG